MKHYLKQNLPGIKAGVEMEKDTWVNDNWRAVDDGSGFDGRVYIPPSEFSDWIEERDGMWKPKEDDFYFIPDPGMYDKYTRSIWTNDVFDNLRFSRGLVYPTPELAIELHNRMIETAKKFWEEKK